MKNPIKSFRTKIFIAIACAMGAILFVFSIVLGRMICDTFLKEELNRMEVLAVIISYDIGKHITERQELNKYIMEKLQHNNNVNSFTVFDYTTTVLASTFESDVNTRTRSEDHLQVLKGGGNKIETFKENKGGTFATVIVPVRSRADIGEEITSGGLEVVYQLETFDTFVGKIRKMVGMIFIVFLLMSIFVTKLISRWVSRPLFSLKSGFAEVSKGNLNVQLPVETLDDFGEVMSQFNKMISDLGKAYVELNDRTRQLVDAREELVRKEKLAILGQLSGSVGHELRNPLGVMNNAVFFLKMVLSEADETTREYLGIIDHEIATSQRIITDLLDFARTKPPQTRMVTACELVEQSLGRCAIPDNVALSIEIPETLPSVNVDPLQIGQVLLNLITNGVQAMPNGGTLRIAARRRVPGSWFLVPGLNQEPGTKNQELDGDFIEISVADTGVGISPENMKKLFQPLFTTKARGIGLGLVVCRNLAEANGGRIEVESRVGEGTTFSLLLPAEER